MGDSKTINQDLLIATKGTLHSMETPTPTDLLFTEDKSKKINHHNYIITVDCDDAQATQKTFIRNKRIIHLESKVGEDFGAKPSSYQGEFVGHGGGVYNGGVHHKHAKATKGSPNVIVESQPLIRTDDPTEQNRNKAGKHNTTGRVKQIAGSMKEEDLESLLSKGCTVESVTTTCSHGREATTDRLEVLEFDVVKLKMVHVNDAEVEPAARAKPKCQVPRRKKQGKLPADAKVHPFFRVQRGAYAKNSYRDALPAIPPEEIPGLEIELGEKWLGKKPETEGIVENVAEKGSLGSATPKDPPGTGALARASAAVDGQRRTVESVGGVGYTRPDVGIREERTRTAATPQQYAAAQDLNRQEAARQAELDQLRDDITLRQAREQQEQFDRNAKTYKEGLEKVDALKKSGALFIDSWRGVKEVFLAKPVEIKVEALGCAGAKPVTIAAYPPKKYAANLLDLKEFRKAFRTIQDLIAGVRRFLALLGKDKVAEKEEGADAPAVAAGLSLKRFTVSISFLAQAAASIWMQYRELERDATLQGEAKGRKKHEVKLAYGVDLSITKLVGIKFNYQVPAAIALGPMGAFIQRVLDELDETQKSGAFVNFDIELAVGVTGTIERDQYGKVWLAREAAIKPVARFTMSLVAAVGDNARIEIGVTIQWQPSFKVKAHNDKPFEVVRDPSFIEIKWFVKAGVNFLGWTIEFNYSDFIGQPIQIGGGPVTIE